MLINISSWHYASGAIQVTAHPCQFRLVIHRETDGQLVQRQWPEPHYEPKEKLFVDDFKYTSRSKEALSETRDLSHIFNWSKKQNESNPTISSLHLFKHLFLICMLLLPNKGTDKKTTCHPWGRGIKIMRLNPPSLKNIHRLKRCHWSHKESVLFLTGSYIRSWGFFFPTALRQVGELLLAQKHFIFR